jgi:segregation and condensation protein A
LAEAGARLAIRLLQDAAVRGEIDPWDVDVIAVVDGFLDQLRQRIQAPRIAAIKGGSYEFDLAETSEAFLAASVLVALKAEVLESSTLPPEPLLEEALESDDDGTEWTVGLLEFPLRPERHLSRRPVAPPPLQRPITLGELIRQLEEIAERLESEPARPRQKQRSGRFSDKVAIAQVTALAHREKLPETTAALGCFLQSWPLADRGQWLGFDQLVGAWEAEQDKDPLEDLDRDRVGVFWALLFLCAQGKVDLLQEQGLFGPLTLRRVEPADSRAWSPLGEGSDAGPALKRQAA